MALVVTIGGVPRTDVMKVGSLRVEHRAAGFVSVCSLVLVDEDYDIAIAAEDAITVVDGAVTYFSGRVVDIDYRMFGKTSRNIILQCQDLNAQLGEVVIDSEEVFTADADADIIDSLFDDYLPAVDSETFVATIQDPLTITVGPCTLRSALSQIGTHTGGYFYVDFDNALHYFDAEANVSAWWLSDTPDQADSFSYFPKPRRVSKATTRLDGVFVVGDDVSGWRGTHAAGDRTAIVRDNRITTLTGRNNRGDAILAKYNAAQVTYTVSTYKTTDLVAGMDIRFISALYGVDNEFTIRRITVKWDVSWTVYYELTLGAPVNPSLIGERIWIDVIEENQGPVSAPRLPTSSRGWSHDFVFSATDHDTVAWAGGKIYLADGTEYAIAGGNTGNMAALTYVFLDIDTSTVALQTTVDGAVAVGSNKVMVAVCANVVAGKDATFKVFDGQDAGLIVGGNIVANAIAAGHIIAGAVETDKLDALAVTAAKIAAGAVVADKLSIGSSFYNAADGLMLFNGFSQLERVGAAWYWWSVGRQRATVTGAIHQVQGRWQGTRALVVEPGTLTNLITNPSFEVNVTDGWTIDAGGGAGAARVTHPRYIGSACMALRAGNANPSYAVGDSVVVADGETIVVSCWAWTEAAPASFTLQLHDVTSGITRDSQAMTKRDTWQYLEAIWENDTGVNKTCYFRFKNDVQNNVAYGYIDACMTCHDLTYGPRYFDGTMGNGYAWTGVAHNSTSTRTKTTVNLNAYRRLVSGNANWSVRVVAQMPLNAVDAWPFSFSQLLDIRQAADNNNRVYVQYRADTDVFGVYINGGMRCSSAAQTFKRGDWVDIVATFNFTTDDYNLYVEGVLVDNDGTVLAPVASPTLFYLGSSITAAQQAGYAFAEFAVFDRVLTAVEVAQMYNLQRPLVDAGTDLAPGIYIVDGKFSISSSTSGARIEIVADMIAGYDAAGTVQFYLQSEDGKAYAGGGAVVLDEDGIHLAGTGAAASDRRVRFYDGSDHMASVWANWGDGAADPAVAWVSAYRQTGDGWAFCSAVLQAYDILNGDDVRVHVRSEGAIGYTMCEITGADITKVDYTLRPGLVANAAALAALNRVEDGCLIYQEDTDKLKVRAAGAWVDLN